MGNKPTCLCGQCDTCLKREYHRNQKRARAAEGNPVFHRAQELPFHHPQRIRQDIGAVIADPDNRFMFSKLFSVALHAEYLLQVLERHGLMHLVVAEQAQRQQEAA